MKQKLSGLVKVQRAVKTVEQVVVKLELSRLVKVQRAVNTVELSGVA